MAYKNNIPANGRSFHVSTAGRDEWSGLSVEGPLRTTAEALVRVSNLTPPVGNGNIADINLDGTGILEEGALSIPAYCSVFGATSGLQTTDSITLNSFAQFNVYFLSLFGEVPALILNDAFNTVVSIKFFACQIPFSSAIVLTGDTDGLIVNIGILDLRDHDIVGITDSNTNISPDILNIDEIRMSGERITAYIQDAPTTETDSVMNVGSINTNTANTADTIALHIKNGTLDCTATRIDAETAIIVESGGILNITCSSIDGDIIVEAGGILNCVIREHAGTITNDGIINGTIHSGNDLIIISNEAGETSIQRTLDPTTVVMSVSDTVVKMETTNSDTGIGGEIRIFGPNGAIQFDSSFPSYSFGDNAGGNLPNKDSDASGETVVSMSPTGFLGRMDVDAFRTLSASGAPVDGTTTAWFIGQIYTDTDTNATYYATVKSTDPDDAAMGSVWVAKVEVLETLISSKSLASSQQPSALDTPIQIEFGAAQVTDQVELSALGTLLFKEAGLYYVTVNGQYGATAAGGGEAALRFRAELNGSPFGNVLSATVRDTKTSIPLLASFWIQANINDEWASFLLRDSSNNNKGGLFQETTALVGWGDSPSAAIIIERFI